MLINVPQNIDVEDKIAGPLTAKQLGWMLLMVAILVVMWLSLPSKAAFFILAIPLAGVFVVLAFVRPYGQTMISLIIAGFKFLFSPKVYVWKRTISKKTIVPSGNNLQTKIAKEEELRMERRKKALGNIEGIAKIIDSKGVNADSDAVSILEKRAIKK